MLITITDQWVKITILEYGKSARSKREKKKKNRNTGFYQNENLCAKDTIKKTQATHRVEGKYLQITYLTIKKYPKINPRV